MSKPAFAIGQVWEHRGELMTVVRVWKRAVKFDLGSYTMIAYEAHKVRPHAHYVGRRKSV